MSVGNPEALERPGQSEPVENLKSLISVLPSGLLKPLRLNPSELREDAAGWGELRPGIRIFTLSEQPGGVHLALLRYAPGARAPRHRHTGDEHIFVLEGEQEDDLGRYGAGSYAMNPTGSVHAVASPGGCLVLIHWMAPPEFLE